MADTVRVIIHDGRAVDPENGRIYGREIATHTDTSGYRQVYVANGKTVQAHRYIWEAVHGPIPPGLTINHKNGVKSDNRIKNLELMTHHENVLHAHRTGLARGRKGAEHPGARLNNIQVHAIRALAEFGATPSELARKTGMSRRQIANIINRKSWTHLPHWPARLEDL